MEYNQLNEPNLKDFFQGYVPLQYAMEPTKSATFNDLQDQNFDLMYNILKNDYDYNQTPMNSSNNLIMSFCISVLVLMLISNKFKLLSKNDRNKKKVPNIKMILLVSLIISLCVSIIN